MPTKKEILLWVVSTSISLLGCEIFLRYWSPPRMPVLVGKLEAPKSAIYGWHCFPNQPYIPYSPDIDGHYDEETLNKEGWHDVDHSLMKPKGAIRILFLGDSNTWGIVDLKHVYTRQLENLLQAAGYPTVEVINMGMPGWGTDQELEALVREGVHYHPDIVVYQYTDNDNSDNIFPNETLDGNPDAVQWAKVFKYRLKNGKLDKIQLVPKKRNVVDFGGSVPKEIFRKSALLFHLNELRHIVVSAVKRRLEPSKQRAAAPKDWTADDKPQKGLSEKERPEMQALFEGLVLKMAEVSRQAGARFAIFPVTDADQGAIDWAVKWKRLLKDEQGYYREDKEKGERLRNPHRRLYDELLQMAQKNGLTVIQPKRAYARYEHDPHPNIRGNEAMAEDLRDFLTGWPEFKTLVGGAPTTHADTTASTDGHR